MVHRRIVYPGAIPQDLDILYTNRDMMVGLGFLAQAVLGNGPQADGLSCIPTTPASLSVLVGPGSIYSLQNLEATAYGSLVADTTNQIVKQGIVQGNTSIALTPPVTTGQSVVYLIQAQYQDQDAGSMVLPYYNAANPAVPFSGPANSGTPQFTYRKGVCVLSLKAGTAATTGSQVAPTPDAGYVGLWTITVANGATTIVSGNIAQASGAPFITSKLTQRVASVKAQSFTTAGSFTYTPDPRLLYASVEIVGAGGGGGGGHITTGSGGAGGGSGGYSRKTIPAATIGASQAVTIGTGGAGGAPGSTGTTGTDGGVTSLGSIMTASGGTGGGFGTTTNAATVGLGGISSGGTVNTKGNSGGNGFGASAANTFCFGGAGGASMFGGAGGGGSQSQAATVGTTGSGGGGGYGNTPGAKGGDGVCIVTEYCY